MRLFLIHGEYSAQQALAGVILDRFGIEAAIPDYLEEVALAPGRMPQRVGLSREGGAESRLGIPDCRHGNEDCPAQGTPGDDEGQDLGGTDGAPRPIAGGQPEFGRDHLGNLNEQDMICGDTLRQGVPMPEVTRTWHIRGHVPEARRDRIVSPEKKKKWYYVPVIKEYA